MSFIGQTYKELKNNSNNSNNLKTGLFPRGRTAVNKLLSPLNLNNKPPNMSNISTQDSNFITRIWAIVKNITNDELYQTAIVKYVNILRLPHDAKRFTNDDLHNLIFFRYI